MVLTQVEFNINETAPSGIKVQIDGGNLLGGQANGEI